MIFLKFSVNDCLYLDLTILLPKYKGCFVRFDILLLKSRRLFFVLEKDI